MGTRPYVLGTGLDELERLGLQHRLWSDAAHAAWLAAGLRAGDHALDVGSGPGFASFDLAQLVTRSGRVVAVDESESFVAHAAAQARARGLDQLVARVGDVADLASVVEAASFDLAYARWVLCFVADPARVVAGVARALRPGGRFVVHDYFNYASMTAAPPIPALTRAVEATARSWRDRGGDPDVAGRLPGLLADAGFEVVSLRVHQRVARPGESMYQWPDTWWRTYTPKLVAMGYLTEGEGRAALAALDDLAASPSAFWWCPPVVEIAATRA